MTAPLVSCVIPVHNGASYLDATLATVFSQTYRPLEVIVVDDGSTDTSAEVARRYGVKLVQQAQGGQAAARNAGIQAASGDYLAFLDADDLWHPGKLTRQMARFEARPELDISVTLIQNFWGAGAGRGGRALQQPSALSSATRLRRVDAGHPAASV